MQAVAPTPAGGQGWPASLRSYVERSFAQKIPDQKKGALNVALKQIISDAQASLFAPVMLPEVHLHNSGRASFWAQVIGCWLMPVEKPDLACYMQAKGELWTRSWETMPLPLSQAAETAALPKPAAAPASWLSQHRAAKASNLAAKPTLEASRKNR